tara:strand:+ start:2280 stop:2837 length:558 start_codon:yes stop_codon:yes gene_type:complete
MTHHLDLLEHSKQQTPQTPPPQTNFEKVIEFNQCFGVPVNNSPQSNICSDQPKLAELRLNLILEEVKELQEAHKNNDFVEIVDAMADILYVVYGMGASYGVPLDNAFDIVHKSNMSKLCLTEKEALETVEWYKKQYTEKKSPYDSPSYREGTYNGKHFWVVFNESTGKILKNINYQIADFTSLLI